MTEDEMVAWFGWTPGGGDGQRRLELQFMGSQRVGHYCVTEQSQKEINLEYSLKRLMLKLQYFGHLMRRTDSLGKTLMLEKIEGRRRSG